MAVSWLHISDIHLGSSPTFEQHLVLKALVSSVERFRKTDQFKPDLIFVTGDIAEKGAPNVFTGTDTVPALATIFFDRLLEAAALDRSKLYIVPGNHDIDREKGEFLSEPPKSVASADKYFDPATKKHHLIEQLGMFSLWYNRFFDGIRSFPDNTTCELFENIEINGCRIAILALNSAIFCKDSATDHGRLFVGRPSLSPLIEQLEQNPHDLSIGLIHHPLDWLSPLERSHITKKLKSALNLLLQGHYHETEIESRDGLIQLATGALWQSDRWPKRALYGVFDHTQVTIHPIGYTEGAAEPTWTCDPSVFPYETNYCKSYPLSGEVTEPSLPKTEGNPEPESDSLYRYQSSLKASLSGITLIGLPTVSSEDAQVSLAETFVHLRISDRWKSELRFDTDGKHQPLEESYSADTILSTVFSSGCRMLLVIGDPGSGKTTLLKHYALCSLDNQQEKLFGSSGTVRVFWLQLRELLHDSKGICSLQENLSKWAGDHSLSIPSGEFELWLRDKNAKSLVLLDGLDEVSGAEKRRAACAWIDRVWSGFPNAHIVVTCRPDATRDGEKISFEAIHKRADVMDFTQSQQREFLEKWFLSSFLGDLCPKSVDRERWKVKQMETAAKKAEELFLHLYPVEEERPAQPAGVAEKQEKRGMQELAGVPLMLQIMAILFKKHESLPRTRALLYSAALDYLLEFRDKRRNIAASLPADKARRVLASVALWMQEELKSDEVAQSKMHKKMEPKLQVVSAPLPPPKAEDFCRHLVERAGVLVEYRTNNYLFRHKTFREYLAGLQLKEDAGKKNRISKLVSCFGDDWWNEPLRFFMGLANEDQFDLFMKELFDSPVTNRIADKHSLLQTLLDDAPEKKTDALCQKLLDPATAADLYWPLLDCLKIIGGTSALDALHEFRDRIKSKAELAADGHKLLDRGEEIIFTLETAAGINHTSLTKVVAPAEPITPSERPASFRNPWEHDARYILVPGGSYIFSVDRKRVTVPDLYVAQYPVTNRQYRTFIDFLDANAPEYQATLPLSSFRDALDELADRRDNPIPGLRSYLDDEPDLVARFRSEEGGNRKFNRADQPVVGVSWYAAQAYCLWLSMLAGEPGSYRLPVEEEWEWAAGGQRDKPAEVLPVRSYPWGEAAPTVALANYAEHTGATTPVDRYPEGATPEGLFDMAGNIWEWMQNCYDKGYDRRSWRGGSWYNDADALRCSSRSVGLPWVGYGDYVGFRVIRSSHSSSY